MSDHTEPSDDGDAMDGRLRDAGERLRSSIESRPAPSVSPTPDAASPVGAGRRVRLPIAIAAAVVLALVSAAVTYGVTGTEATKVIELAAAPELSGEGLAILDGLDGAPIDPRTVELTASVSRFGSCDALLDRVRRVGAEHVGSRGFGTGTGYYGGAYDARLFARSNAATYDSAEASTPAPAGGASGETVGTNVQVAGVDEPDMVKAAGAFIYSLRGGRLRITDTATRAVVSFLDLESDAEVGPVARTIDSSSRSLLVAGDLVVVFGNEYVTSEPIEGDPSAARSTDQYLTVTQIDVADRSNPTIVDRTRLEGFLVGARLVGDQVRMVTGWSMTDIGFVVPTSPESIPVALERNRRSLANSEVTDWIPEWDDGGDPTPLVSCENVFVPDTFAGVSMTSMVSFTVDGSFDPTATSLLAPSTVIYSTAETVAISSTVWVDPADQLGGFDDWKSAVHRFDLTSDSPTYVGSGRVDGTISGQFNFGEVGERLAVISSSGSPWSKDDPRTTLTIFETNDGALNAVGRLDNLAGGGHMNAVRFTENRLFVAVGLNGRVGIVDTSDATNPAMASTVETGGRVGYIHPLSAETVVTFGSRQFARPNDPARLANAAHLELLDSTNPTEPSITGVWDLPYSWSEVAGNHHALLHWESAAMFGFGVQMESEQSISVRPAPRAQLMSTQPGLAPLAEIVPQRVDPPPPCPKGDPRDYTFGQPYRDNGSSILECDEGPRPDYPGYSCTPVLTSDVLRCYRRQAPTVHRVLVVDGQLWLYTDESLESLNRDTFASTGAIPIS